MPLTVTQASEQALENIPIPARPRVDPADVRAPEGYAVEPVVVGLTFPNSMAFGDDGTLYLCEGGGAWPFRPYVGARVLALEPSGRVREVVTERRERLMGVAHHDGALYAVAESDMSRLVRFDLATGRRETLVEVPAGGGIHPPTGPVIGPDGDVYFGQATAGINGVIDPRVFVQGVGFKNPGVRDVPGEDVTLAGVNYPMPDPRAPVPLSVQTGAFKPFGAPGERGEVVAGETKCTTSVLRCRPDGSDVELLAWGVRVGIGMAFDERGRLFVSDNNMEDHAGVRAVANDPDRVWRIRGAEAGRRGGSTPPWHGFPDVCADGKPVDDPSHHPTRGPPPERLIEDPPRFAGKPPVLLEPHTGLAKMDACTSDAFGHRGDLFLATVGNFGPATTPREERFSQGFGVLRIDPDAGRVEPFLQNHRPGPASPVDPREGARTGGIERPIDCKFSPDGRSLYVLEIGRIDVLRRGLAAWGRTGVLWRVTPEQEVA